MLPPRRRPSPAPPAPRSAPGKVRIIAGRLRGSRLAVPDAPGLRPTPDRVRTTLFNWLQPVIEGAQCLDLYAGSGALGIEALSRGAAEVVLVESDPRLAAALRANLERLRQPNGRVVNADARTQLAQPGARYDLVFVDPPFAQDLWTATLEGLARGGSLKPGALVYVEAPVDAAYAVPAGWTLWRESTAGAVRYVLWRVAPAGPASPAIAAAPPSG